MALETQRRIFGRVDVVLRGQNLIVERESSSGVVEEVA